VIEASDLPLEQYPLTPPVVVGALPEQGNNNQGHQVHTGAGDFYVRQYTSLSYRESASIPYENRLLTWLAEQLLSFAVPMPLATRDGSLITKAPGGPLALVPWLPGRRLELGNLEEVEELGATVGELQAALRGYPHVIRPGHHLFRALLSFPSPQLDATEHRPEQFGLPADAENAGLFATWRTEAARLRDFLAGPYRDLPVQVGHNDITHNNVLVENGRISAVLDFEYADLAPRALDLIQGLRLSMLILDGPDPLRAAQRFLQGYRRWMILTEPEARALPTLLRLRAAITTLWWMGRALDGDDPSPIPHRIWVLQQTIDWTDRLGDQLVELAIRQAT
jgi:homoserine kinase type II